jgi:segregation and condensation protein B
VERIRGVDSDYTIRTLLHRRLVVELGRSDGPGRPYLYGTGFEFLERFGLTSLEELPFLDVDVAARLGEEGGDAVTQPMFREADLAAGGVGAARGQPTGPEATGDVDRRSPDDDD